jgi:GNAT superfamily N-acetyltransferase
MADEPLTITTLPDFPWWGQRVRVASPLGRLVIRRPNLRMRVALDEQGTVLPWDKPGMERWNEQLALVTEAGEPAFLWASESPLFKDGDQTFYQPGQLEVAPAFLGTEVALAGLQAIAARARHLGLDRIAIFCLNHYHSPRARPFYNKIGALPYCYETSVADCIPLWLPPDVVSALAEAFERRLQDGD